MTNTSAQTAAARQPAPELEADLEQLFRRFVVGVMKGRLLKLAPIERGTPDRLALLPGGRLMLVELKTKTGRLSPAQTVWHAKAAALGIQVDVLYGREQIEDWVAANNRLPR